MILGATLPAKNLNPHAQRLLAEHGNRINMRCDRMFAGLFVLQWIAEMVIAVVRSPRSWVGAYSSVHPNLWAAVFLGGAIISFPLLLIAIRPGTTLTKHVVAVAQMLSSALIIHLSGGRIETHFHIFGSLAFLAFYRDWRVLITATVIVTLDHILRGMLWPQSIFGTALVSNWRWMEHAGWVLFEDVFLITKCFHTQRDMAQMAQQQADALDQGEMRSAKLTQALGDRTAILAALDEGAIITTTDAQGRILSVNDNFCRISRYSREELLGKDHRILSSGLHPREFWEQMFKVVRAGGVWHGEIRNRAKDGTLHWVDTTIKGMMDDNGCLTKMVTVRADITDRKNTELQLSQSQRLDSIGQMAAGIAHEINTPTQYVGDNTRFVRDSFVQLLSVMDRQYGMLHTRSSAKSWQERFGEIEALRQQLDLEFLREEIPKALDQSIQGLESIAKIVGAMKEFSHPGSQSKEPADLNAAIESTTIVCRNRWKSVADLELNLDPNLPRVSVLLGEFNQVILNLIVNASDAIGESIEADPAHKGHIQISTRSIGQEVEIRVQDNGPGIPAAVAKKIFEPFFTTKPVGKGTGQGLMLSRNVIVKRHGGDLSFSSTEGKGTTFVLRLPVHDSNSIERVAA